ncbi:MAG: DUF1598 domain-containing protein [Planctomycetales bacterium]
MKSSRGLYVGRSQLRRGGWGLGIVLALVVVSQDLLAGKGTAPPSQSPASRLLEERLAAGEFGPALDALNDMTDSAEQSRHLRKIAAAQREQREFRAAQETARRIPEQGVRRDERREGARDQGRSGGGAQADFTELIELITSTVAPENWDEVGGAGSVRQYNTGVYVNPQGVMRQLTKEERGSQLEGLHRRARSADLNDDLAQSSTLRMVSLRRLERAVAEAVAAGRPPAETLRRLAGLTRVQYVLVYPEEQELIIAGPAEGWRYDDSGRAVGLESGQPLLDLDDLVVILRAFAPGADGLFGCSINTRDANLKRVKEFVETSTNAGPLRPGQLGKWLKELHTRLGLQDIVVHGVPANTRVAQVLVEADYKMKLIGVKKLDGGPDIPSYFDLLRRAGKVSGIPLEALRWWLTMKYDAIAHDPDRAVFEFRGGSVQVMSENQFVNAQGQHVPTGVAEPINRRFAENFTKHYAQLAEREPVFADLRNLFDMALAAALCQQERLHEKIDWDLGIFAPGGAYHPAQVEAPKVVDSVINHQVYGGRDIVVQVAGGVQADLIAIASDKQLARSSAQLQEVTRKTPLPEGRWWWDAGVRHAASAD